MPEKTRILLIDCERPPLASNTAQTVQGELGQQFEVLTARTGWNGGSPPLDFQQADVIFINANYQDRQSATLHIGDDDNLKKLLQSGSAVFLFVGNCADFHLAILTGYTVSKAEVQGHAATACQVYKRTPMDPLFSKMGNRLTVASSLQIEDQSPFLLTGNYLSAGYVIDVGKGCCVFLPYFGEAIPEAIVLIVKEVLPDLCPHLVFDDQFKWLTEDQYLMPSLAGLRKERETVRQEFEKRDHELGEQFDDQWKTVQAGWNELLTTSGDTVKLAVKRALEVFGWQVIDVDTYWEANGQAGKREEDLWLGDSPDPHPSQPGVALVEVKSKERAGASDDDYYALVKYMNRRMRDFKNTDLWGMLVINHAYLTPATNRRQPFSEKVIADSKADRIVLTTTWDMFRVVQALQAGTKTAEAVRGLLSVPGLVEL